ncbi:hypothetical protein [Catenovulum maritimum]|nr:hypothetical protein [Catenovulum maritimum]
MAVQRRRLNSTSCRRKHLLKKIHNKVIGRRKNFANQQMEETVTF